MKSTGEVMGGATTFGAAFAKAQQSVGQRLPEKGSAFISVNNDDKPNVLPIARNLAELGFQILATRGTAAYLRAHGIQVEVVFKVNEGRPNIVDHILNNQVQILVNTPLGRESFFDDRAMRRAAMMHNVPCITTLTGASAAVEAIRAVRAQALDVSEFRTTARKSPPALKAEEKRFRDPFSPESSAAFARRRACGARRYPRHCALCRHIRRHFRVYTRSVGARRLPLVDCGRRVSAAATAQRLRSSLSVSSLRASRSGRSADTASRDPRSHILRRHLKPGEHRSSARSRDGCGRMSERLRRA
jgi:hypothetical protein